MPQSTTHKSHEKSKPLSEENTRTRMLSTWYNLPQNVKKIMLEFCPVPQQDLIHVCGFATIHKYYRVV